MPVAAAAPVGSTPVTFTHLKLISVPQLIPACLAISNLYVKPSPVSSFFESPASPLGGGGGGVFDCEGGEKSLAMGKENLPRGRVMAAGVEAVGIEAVDEGEEVVTVDAELRDRYMGEI
jgi:hypothetical protein